MLFVGMRTAKHTHSVLLKLMHNSISILLCCNGYSHTLLCWKGCLHNCVAMGVHPIYCDTMEPYPCYCVAMALHSHYWVTMVHGAYLWVLSVKRSKAAIFPTFIVDTSHKNLSPVSHYIVANFSLSTQLCITTPFNT